LAAAIVDPEARALSPSAIQNEFFVDRTEALAPRIAPTVEVSTVPAGVAEAQLEEQSNPPVEQTPVTFPSASITRVTPTVPVAPTAPVAASAGTPLPATPSRAAFTGNVVAPSPSGPAAFAPVQPSAAAVESSVDATPDSVAVEVEQLVEATAVSQPITPKMPLLPARAPLPEISVPARLDRASSDGLDTPFYLAYAAVLAAALAGCVLIVRRI